MKKPYSIGLDIGTNSVGYAIVTEDYKVPSKKMKILGNTDKTRMTKNLLGVALFEEGNSAESTRIKRTARRRYSRRKNRLRYLQDIFMTEMFKVDESFFHRLEESFLTEEDKVFDPFPIFANQREEKRYYEEFPTIYHLREKLANSHEPADLRLIYLALAHMMKFRGHFLYESIDFNLDNIDLAELFSEFLELYNQLFGTDLVYIAEVSDILTDTVSRTQKVEAILKLYPSQKKAALNPFLKLIVGNKADFQKIFKLEEKASLQMTSDTFEEDLDGLIERIGDEFGQLCQVSKNIYDAVILSNILTVSGMNTQSPLSASMIQRYNDHKKDLAELKQFFRNHFSYEIFKDVFRDSTKNGYAGYIEGKTKQEDFYRYMSALLKGKVGAEDFLKKIERENFLRKQRTFDNGSIPHQLHLRELKAILAHQGEFYPFLKENQEKIEKIFTFRIPYYVGPLSKDDSRFAWLIRKSDEAIRPWNFDEVVDKEQSAQEFISGMTLRDLYLPEENVLPRHSMLYELYTVLNELTKVKLVTENGIEDYFDVDLKKEIIDGLFKVKRKVSKKDLLTFLENTNIGFRISDIRGIEKAFNANLGTYHDFIKMGIPREVLDNPENDSMFEDIVLALTVFEDRDILKKRLSAYKPFLGNDIVKTLSRKHYTGWGRLSRKLLNGVKHKESSKTILDYLWDDPYVNRNFMQLIKDDDLDFKGVIEEQQRVTDEQDLVTLVDELPGSPAIKKGIRQSIKVVDELIAIMGYNPSHIFIEMARENQTTRQGQDRSKERLTRLKAAYKGLNEETVVLPKDNKDLKNIKFYLYYLQNGKDMYTGQPLDLSRLSEYDVDHIIPRSFIKDNSIDNCVLTASNKNRGKSDNVPSHEIVQLMKSFWKRLKKSGLISERKYLNLTKGERGGLLDKDKFGFIQRQLVETRQITKHVARLLAGRYSHSDTDVKVVTMKASLVSSFRKNFELYKLREINDYHHAHDAYLNAVVGQALLKVYPKIERELVYGQFKRINHSYQDKATQEKYFYQNIMKFFDKKDKVVDVETGEIIWDSAVVLPTIKKVLSYHQVNVAKKREIQTGQFSKESILPHADSDKLIARKRGWDPKKYGGFDSPTIAYSVFVVADVEKGKAKKLKEVRELIGITIMERQAFETNPIAFLQAKGYFNIKDDKLIRLPKYSLFEMSDGRRRLLASAGELQKGNEMVLPKQWVDLLYHGQKINSTTDHSHYDYVKEHRLEFSKLFDYLLEQSQSLIQKPKVESRLLKVWNEQKDTEDLSLLSESFVNLLKLTSFGAPGGFKFMGDEIKQSNLRYQTVTEVTKSILIHQSVTGLYETRIDLRRL